jgi:hypothetical protein
MVGFVDDSTGTVNSFTSDAQPTTESLLGKMQQDAQLWHDLLWCSGSMLELPKCSYHFLYFDYEPEGTPIPRGDQVGPTLTIQSPNNEPVAIPSKSAFNSHKTLGHLKAPAGQGTTQIKTLCTKQSTLSQCLASSPATATQASAFYHTIYLPSIYVLPQSFFGDNVLDDAEKKSMPSIFAKTGTIATPIAHYCMDPPIMLAEDLSDGNGSKAKDRSQTCLKYWRTEGQVSKTLWVAVSWYQYEAGVSWSLFEDVTTKVNYTSARWLPSLHQFLSTIDGHFDLDDAYITPPECEHDIHLMDLVTQSNAFTKHEAAILNYCRMYLSVATLSDISTAQGDMLIPGIEWGGLDQMSSSTTGHTNHQHTTDIFFWTYWQRLLQVIATPQGKLVGHLGNWLEPGGRLRRRWNAYYDPKYKFLYRLQNNTYQQYELFDTRFINGCTPLWQPNDHCVPISIRETSTDCWEVTAPHAIPEHPERPLIAQTFQDYIHSTYPIQSNTYLPTYNCSLSLMKYCNSSMLNLCRNSTTTHSAPIPTQVFHPPSIWYRMAQNWPVKSRSDGYYAPLARTQIIVQNVSGFSVHSTKNPVETTYIFVHNGHFCLIAYKRITAYWLHSSHTWKL